MGEIEDALLQLLESARVPGAAVAIVRDGTIAWHGGYGVKRVDTAEPVTADTRFQAASLSKPVFAYAVLQLAERGLLNLDRPLADYAGTSFAPDDSLIRRVTARHCLAHTTGWPNWRPKGEELQREFAPGARFGYSGEGYTFLQRAVEQITGQPLSNFMQQTLLAPLGMEQSDYRWASPADETVADSHDKTGRRRPRDTSEMVMAAASLHTTTADFARFLVGLLTAGEEPWRLRPATLRAMFSPQIAVANGLTWGLGWGLEETPAGPVFWHWGDNAGYKNFVAGSLDQRQGIVILTNGDGGTRLWSPLFRMILGDTHPALEWLAARYGYEIVADYLAARSPEHDQRQGMR